MTTCCGGNTDLKELGTAQVEEEVWEVGEARGPLEAGGVVLGEVPKLGGNPDEDSVQPPQHIKDVLLTTPAHK